MKRVLTFGCFDLFHSGHVAFLKKASQLGLLLVAIGDDNRVRALKGLGRPVMRERERLATVKACKYVDKAHLFSVNPVVGEDEAHLEIVRKFDADILVAGENTNLGKGFIEAVREIGVEYHVLSSEPPTTSEIIRRITDPNLGCPEEVAEHLAGYEVSQQADHSTDPDELCPVCYHHHKPISEGGCHLD